MVEFLVTCSLAIYLVALLYGAYRVFASRDTEPPIVAEHARTFRLIPGRGHHFQTTPDLPYYV